MENKIVNLQINDNLNETTKSVDNLKTQLRQAQNEVNALSEKFGSTSREAVEAAKRAGELKDKIGDAKALTDAFNPDAKFKALSSSLSGVAGGFSAVQGGMALFGKQSEDVEKTLLKVQSAMALSQGLQTIGESVDSFKQLGAVLKNTSAVQKVMTAATAAYTFVNQAATTGLKVFRLALIGTGIGAIVVGLGLLIANFDKVKETIMKVIPGLSSVSKVIGGIVNSITDFVGATSEASRALDKLKENADKTLSVNKKFMQEHGDQVDEYTKKKIDAKNAYAEAVKEDGADQVALAKRLNRELADIEFSRGDEKRKLQKEANDKASAERKTNNENVKKQNEDDAKKLKEEKAKAVISEAESFRNQLEAVEKVESDAKKANADALLTEQELAISNENLAYQAKLDNAIKFGTSKEEIETQHLNNLNNINLTAQEKQYNDDKINADKKIANEQAVADAKNAIQNQSLDNVSSGIGVLKGVFEKNKAIQKGLLIAENAAGIAKIIINTMAGNAKAVAASPLTGGMPFVAANTIGAGISIASSIAATAKGLAALGGGSAGSAGSVGGATPPAAPQFNVVGQGGANQLAQTMSSKEQQPIKAYVTAGDVTTGQSLNRNIINNASMG